MSRNPLNPDTRDLNDIECSSCNLLHMNIPNEYIDTCKYQIAVRKLKELSDKKLKELNDKIDKVKLEIQEKYLVRVKDERDYFVETDIEFNITDMFKGDSDD